MNHWIFKSEPGSYSWDDLITDGVTEWTGVRNAQAAAYLRMAVAGDTLLFYHSGKTREAVGIACIARGPQAEAERWVSVAIAPERPLARPVTLAAMKAEPALAGMVLLKQSRLSVVPVGAAEWRALLQLAA